jgi:D-cysteine desulfhydrase
VKTPRLRLAHLPTPLERHERLAQAFGLDLWIKRDDCSAGPEAGNKIRKLELLLADARRRGATALVTCGGIQSNHARATALLAARLGLKALLCLRVTEPLDVARGAVERPIGLLDRLAGATVRLWTPAEYRDRATGMAAVASELAAAGEVPYVIPEGGSNGLGALGYALAMREVRSQLDVGLAGGRPFDAIVHACGSGGTAAGIALGASAFDVAEEVRAIAVCDDAPTFHARIAAIVDEARAIEPGLGRAARLIVDDTEKGPAYGVASEAHKVLLVRVARLSGLCLDPVYTGKAFAALAAAAREELAGRRVLFIHTGGLPGLLAQSAELAGPAAS